MVDISESEENNTEQEVLETSMVAEENPEKEVVASKKVNKQSPLVNFISKIKEIISPDNFGNSTNKKSNKPIKKNIPHNSAVDVASDGEDPRDTENSQQVYRGEPLMATITRNQFYKDGYRNLVKLAIAEAIIIILLILAFVSYINVSKSEDRYFATTADGRIMKMIPLDRANMSTSSLMSWVAQASSEIMTFGFHDYQTRLQKSSRHFTRHGWEGFTRALQRSKIIEAVEAAGQVVTCKPRSAPILIQEGIFNGKYRWVVDLPLQVSYRSSQKSRVDNLMVRMVIDRVTSLENPYGIGIEQWIAKAN